MQRNENYRTKQRHIILSKIKEQDKSFTAKELYEALGGEIGLTTIYRTIEKLSDEGVLLKTTKDNTAEYQYLAPCPEDNHFFLKCDSCGVLEHIDCRRVRGLTEHIAKAHHFIPIKAHIIINGLCAKCVRRR